MLGGAGGDGGDNNGNTANGGSGHSGDLSGNGGIAAGNNGNGGNGGTAIGGESRIVFCAVWFLLSDLLSGSLCCVLIVSWSKPMYIVYAICRLCNLPSVHIDHVAVSKERFFLRAAFSAFCLLKALACHPVLCAHYLVETLASTIPMCPGVHLIKSCLKNLSWSSLVAAGDNNVPAGRR